MPDLPQQVLAALDVGTPAVWLCVTRTRGSVPRETGAAMLVTASGASGTIGGGHLEFKAIEFAREWLAQQRQTATQRHFPLGPALGQCCGGAVELTFVPLRSAERADWQRLAATAAHGGRFQWSLPLDNGAVAALELAFAPWQVWVFGAGHVGRAIVQVLATLPCHVTWVDSREEWLLPEASGDIGAQVLDATAAAATAATWPSVTRLVTDDPAYTAAEVPPGADVLVLTHSHALDFDIVWSLLRRADLGYVGVIGSDTKAATFRKRLAARGLPEAAIARMVCPFGKADDAARVGDGGPLRKLPGVIAVQVAAALIARQQLLANSQAQYGLTAKKWGIVDFMAKRALSPNAVGVCRKSCRDCPRRLQCGHRATS